MFRDIIEQAKRVRAVDKERWDNIDHDLCQVCGDNGDDRRTLFINCFYQLKEISQKFIDLFDTDLQNKGYALRICKGCRSALLIKLSEWIGERGRLKYGNLDDDGILSFNTVEAFNRHRELIIGENVK